VAGGQLPSLNFRLAENFPLVGYFSLKSIDRKKISFTLKFRKPVWTEQSKVTSGCILKFNFFMQTDVLNE